MMTTTYRQTHWPEDRRPPGTVLHSSDEMANSLNARCQDDSTTNTVIIVIIITIIIPASRRTMQTLIKSM